MTADARVITADRNSLAGIDVAARRGGMTYRFPAERFDIGPTDGRQLRRTDI